MLANHKIKPGSPFPTINLMNTQGQLVDLGFVKTSVCWKLLVVYRGLHCPYCRQYLQNINQMIDKFEAIDMDVLAVSGDSEKNALQQEKQDNLSFMVAYGLTLNHMQNLGLYISNPISSKEADRPFVEPAMFVIDGAGHVVLVNLSNSPLCFPDINHLLSGISHIKQGNYPIRGNYDPLSPHR